MKNGSRHTKKSVGTRIARLCVDQGQGFESCDIKELRPTKTTDPATTFVKTSNLDLASGLPSHPSSWHHGVDQVHFYRPHHG
jgi:hypothetical protein